MDPHQSSELDPDIAAFCLESFSPTPAVLTPSLSEPSLEGGDECKEGDAMLGRESRGGELGSDGGGRGTSGRGDFTSELDLLRFAFCGSEPLTQAEVLGDDMPLSKRSSDAI